MPLDRLFEAVHVGVYAGRLGPDSSTTLSANPHLKLIFGYASDAAASLVRPFDVERFVDPQARAALVERLAADGTIADYLLRLKRADGSLVWIELTGRADPPDTHGVIRLETLVRDVSERRKLDEETKSIHHHRKRVSGVAAHNEH